MRSFHLFAAVVAISAGLIANAGCPSREVSRVDPAPSKEQQKSLPAQVNRNIDILFVIDDSGSMEEEQTSLVANFSNFINVLSNIEGGLPDVHIGVVSTNLGGNADNQCQGTGDAGNLINTPREAVGCTGPSDRWIESVDDGNMMGNRITNFDPGQTLTETFSCIAELGTGGCGFEQPLESMKRALTNQANAGFVRDNAFLAVIIITDEDDCSVDPINGPAMFANQACTNYLDKSSCPLGALSSFRCFEFGVQCNPDSPRSVGDKEVSEPCLPRENSQYMPGIKDYAEFLRGFKGNPGLVITAGIIGPPTPVVVEPTTIQGGGGQTIDTVRLAPSCVSGAGEAAPGVRLSAFFNEFPTRSTVTTICNEDLSDALLQIADLLARVIGSPCMEGDLADRDNDPSNGVQPDCAVYDVLFPNTDDEVQGDPMPECNDSLSNVPCYHIEPDAAQCGGTPTELKITIERGSTEPPIGTEAQIRCVAN